MDERIANLMKERGHEDLLMTVDDPELRPKLADALDQLWLDGDAIRAGIGRSVVRNLKSMARMGLFFEQEVRRRFPDFETRSGLVPWEDYLPPLDPVLRALCERWDESDRDAPAPSPAPAPAPEGTQ